MFLPDFVCLFVCLSVYQQNNSKSYGRIFLKFSANVGNGKNYQWFNFNNFPDTRTWCTFTTSKNVLNV